METVRKPWWTARQLRDAIERCNAECSQLIAQRAPAKALEGRRKCIEQLMRELQEAEQYERRRVKKDV